jgi:flagellar biosynthesis component FlhA
MKKFDLIHVTILIVAILLGYNSIQLLIAALDSFVMAFNPGFPNLLNLLINNCMLAALYAVACYVLIRNARKYAGLILKDDESEESILKDEESAARLHLELSHVLFAFFIGLGLYTIIESLPQALDGAYQLFSGKISPENSMTQQVSVSGILIHLLKIVVGAFLIYASPNLTNFIETNIAPRLNSGGRPEQSSIHQLDQDV